MNVVDQITQRASVTDGLITGDNHADHGKEHCERYRSAQQVPHWLFLDAFWPATAATSNQSIASPASLPTTEALGLPRDLDRYARAGEAE